MVELWWVEQVAAHLRELIGGGCAACGRTGRFEGLTGKRSTSGGGDVVAATRNWEGRYREERGVNRPERSLVVRLFGICYQPGHL